MWRSYGSIERFIHFQIPPTIISHHITSSHITSHLTSQCFELRQWPHQHALTQFMGSTPGLTWQIIEKLDERDMTLDRVAVCFCFGACVCVCVVCVVWRIFVTRQHTCLYIRTCIHIYTIQTTPISPHTSISTHTYTHTGNGCIRGGQPITSSCSWFYSDGLCACLSYPGAGCQYVTYY